MASGADRISAVAAMSKEELRAVSTSVRADGSHQRGYRPPDLARLSGVRPSRRGGDLDRAWVVERYGISTATARALTRRREGLGHSAPHRVAVRRGYLLRQDAGGGRRGDTRDRSGTAATRPRSAPVRDLADIARSTAELTESLSPPPSDHDRRFLRFNDQCRTMTVQCPPSPTPRPGPRSRPRPARSPPMARRPGTSVAATPSWRWSARRPAHGSHDREPVLRRRARPAGRPRRRRRRNDQACR